MRVLVDEMLLITPLTPGPSVTRLSGTVSVLYIAETRLSYLCDVCVPASSGLFEFVPLENSNQSSGRSWHFTKIGFSDPRKSGHWQIFPNPSLCHLDLDMDKIWADKIWADKNRTKIWIWAKNLDSRVGQIWISQNGHTKFRPNFTHSQFYLTSKFVPTSDDMAKWMSPLD